MITSLCHSPVYRQTNLNIVNSRSFTEGCSCSMFWHRNRFQSSWPKDKFNQIWTKKGWILQCVGEWLLGQKLSSLVCRWLWGQKLSFEDYSLIWIVWARYYVSSFCKWTVMLFRPGNMMCVNCLCMDSHHTMLATDQHQVTDMLKLTERHDTWYDTWYLRTFRWPERLTFYRFGQAEFKQSLLVHKLGSFKLNSCLLTYQGLIGKLQLEYFGQL